MCPNPNLPICLSDSLKILPSLFKDPELNIMKEELKKAKNKLDQTLLTMLSSENQDLNSTQPVSPFSTRGQADLPIAYTRSEPVLLGF